MIDGGTFSPANTVTIDPSRPYYQASVPPLAPSTKYTVHVIENDYPVQSAQAPCGLPGGTYDATSGSFTTQ